MLVGGVGLDLRGFPQPALPVSQVVLPFLGTEGLDELATDSLEG